MKRLYLPIIEINKDKQIILEDNYFINYIKNVLRYQIDEKIIILSNRVNYFVKIEVISKRKIVFKILRREDIPKKDSSITLIQSIFKWERFEWMLEKVVELGVDRIIPVITNRTTTKVHKWDSRVKRFEKIIYKALTQSHQNIVPEIMEPIKLSDLTIKGERIFFDTVDDIPIFNGDSLNKNDISIFIGPEGGINNLERELLKEKGFKQYRLNLPILRAETAAIISVAIINMRFNKWINVHFVILN